MKKKWMKYASLMLFLELTLVVGMTGCAKTEKVYLDQDVEENVGGEQEERKDKEEKSAQGTIFVYVCGAVKEPGVYELKADQRVCDALEAAGGLTEEAAPEAFNQAEMLSDGQMIRVLTAQEMQEQKQQAQESESGLTNINTADAKTLMQLPGIGESKAGAIIAYREEHGGFQSTEELMQIGGIKEGVYNKIKDSITVN